MRNELLQAEIELRRATEAVAQQRRKLPPGGVIPQDYASTERKDDAETKSALSELFGQHDTLMAYNFMYGPDMEAPCPSCTSILDSLDGVDMIWPIWNILDLTPDGRGTD